MPVVAYQIMYIQGGDLETSNLVAHIDSQFFEEKNNTCFTVLQDIIILFWKRTIIRFLLSLPAPIPDKEKKLT